MDIVIEKDNGRIVTVDVKGLAGTSCWFMENAIKRDGNHFIILVSFLNKIENHSILPKCWIIPSTELEPLLHCNEKGKHKDIHTTHLVQLGKKFKENWDLPY
ncbi:MAG: hypothetical protein ACYC5N_06690 [Endomicrobiales bacterium]